MRAPFLCSLLIDIGFTAAASSVSFEPNIGKTDPQVRHLARSSAGKIFFTADAIYFPGAAFHLDGIDKTAQWETAEPTRATTSYITGRDASRWTQGVPSYQRLVRHNIYPGIDL